MSVLEQNSRRKTILGEEGNALTMLLIVNAVVFVLISFVKVLYLLNDLTIEQFTDQIVSYIALPAAADAFITKPWTLLTYMFSHISLWHFVSNMLWLWGFGFIINDIAGSKKVVPLFLYGGFFGGISFFLTINLIPSLRESVQLNQTLLGAGPALMCIAIGTTTLAPRYRLFPMINGGIPIWIFTAIFVAIHIATIGKSIGAAAGYAFAGIMGWVFVWQLKKGSDWGQWMIDFTNWLNNLFNPDANRQPANIKNQLFYKADQKPFEKTPHVTQQRVDELLDKIHQQGYYALSEEEKEFLKKAAKEEL